jgi:hypothetical protein
MQKLQVYVYSKPSTIKLRIINSRFILTREIDTIEVEIPGDKCNTITSAGIVLKEAYFACGRENIRSKRYAFLVNQDLDADEMRDLQQSQWKVNEEFEFEGFISYRTEWSGLGPKMPPDSMDMHEK